MLAKLKINLKPRPVCPFLFPSQDLTSKLLTMTKISPCSRGDCIRPLPQPALIKFLACLSSLRHVRALPFPPTHLPAWVLITPHGNSSAWHRCLLRQPCKQGREGRPGRQDFSRDTQTWPWGIWTARSSTRLTCTLLHATVTEMNLNIKMVVNRCMCVCVLVFWLFFFTLLWNLIRMEARRYLGKYTLGCNA